MAEKRASSKRRSAGEWQALVSELAESGEDLAKFCRYHGVYPPTLRWWQWRLRGLCHEPGRSGRATRAAVQPVALQFAELRVAEAASGTKAAEGFELRWPDGLTLAIPLQFDEGSLRRLLEVLEVGGC